jgi:hypothetical protein
MLSMHAVMRRLPICIVVFFMANDAGAGSEEAWTPPRVVLEPPGSEPSSERRPWVRLSIENDGPDCAPVLITGLFFVPGEDRPATLLDFHVVDRTGRSVASSPSNGLLRPSYRLMDLMVLWCGATYSWRVPLDKPEWRYPLGPGLYKVRAGIKNRVRAFFDQHPAEKTRLFSAFRIEERGHRLPMLRDFSIESNEVELRIGNK